jgi:hypothetical protein
VLNAGVLALAASFLFLVLLLAGAAAGAAWDWRVKVSAIAAASLFAAATTLSIPGLLGWPTDQVPPSRFRLLAVNVQQPDKQTRDPGAVFLWAVDAGNLAQDAQPRAYRLPYSGSLHEAAAAAASRLGTGVAQLGELSGSEPPAGGWLEEPGAGQAVVTLKFYDVPDPLYPEG